MNYDNGSFHYTYDALNRLMQVQKDEQPIRTYRYDAYGNRIEKTLYTDSSVSTIAYRYNTMGWGIAWDRSFKEAMQ